MISAFDFSTWNRRRLLARIDEGEALLGELPPDSGWVPLVARRLGELRDALSRREVGAAA